MGTLPFILLGAIHIIYTLIDIKTPRKLVPFDDKVRILMQKSTPKLTRQTTMWRAWVGFNISHGIGVLFFGLIYFVIAVLDSSILVRITPLLYLATVVALCYLILSIKYWFHIPAIGSGIGFACFVVALFLTMASS
jgi:hypothetical protein